MPALAPLQKRPASQQDAASVQARQAAQRGPMLQLASALNGRPQISQLQALSTGLSGASHAAPVQRVFSINRGKTYTKGDEVRNSTTLAKHLGNEPKKSEIVDAVVKMAEDVKDYHTLSWLDVIKEAKKTIGGDSGELLDFSHILEDTEDMGRKKEIRKLNRTNSMDFSDLFKKQFGETTGDLRKDTMKFEFTSEVEDHETQNFTTSGPGRFMSMSNKQIGDTKYSKFIPTLKNKVGKSEEVTAQLLLHGLMDKEKYSDLAKKEKLPKKGQLALEQTLALLNNEIISRSSSNLMPIVGVLQSVSQGKTTSMLDGFNTVGMFIPTAKEHKPQIGGQALSRIHHKGSKARKHFDDGKFDTSLKRLYENYRGGVHVLSKRLTTDIPGLKLPINKLNTRYIANLSKTTKVKRIEKQKKTTKKKKKN